MEKTWGRRVFGSVTNDGDFTKFLLQMYLGEKPLTTTTVVSNEELEAQPLLYGNTLDRMVYEMDRYIESDYNTFMQ